MNKAVLKDLIDLIDEDDEETIFKLLIRFIPEDKAFSDEIEAIKRANESIEKYGTVSHDDVNWDL
jgi:hypothetical protein